MKLLKLKVLKKLSGKAILKLCRKADVVNPGDVAKFASLITNL